MPSKITDAERSARAEKFREELTGYVNRFAAAFDELHDAVVRQAKTPGQYVGPHYDYPIMSSQYGGFPSFNEAGYFQDSTPRDYVGVMRPRGLAGMLIGSYQRPEVGFSKGAELAEFL